MGEISTRNDSFSWTFTICPVSCRCVGSVHSGLNPSENQVQGVALYGSVGCHFVWHRDCSGCGAGGARGVQRAWRHFPRHARHWQLQPHGGEPCERLHVTARGHRDLGEQQAHGEADAAEEADDLRLQLRHGVELPLALGVVFPLGIPLVSLQMAAVISWLGLRQPSGGGLLALQPVSGRLVEGQSKPVEDLLPEQILDWNTYFLLISV